MLSVAVLGSGRGSNFQAILDAIQRDTLRNVRICIVISNNSGAGILEIARANGIPAVHLSQRVFPDETAFVDALLETLQKHGTNFVALAGYMKRIHPRVIAAYRNRIVNIHPALLPKHGGKGMYGENVHRAVIASGERISGATVHIVDEEFDHGAVVLQQQVILTGNDTPETLAAKVLDVEHAIFPRALQLFADGKVTSESGRVTVHTLAS